jgi:hypothetical protein
MFYWKSRERDAMPIIPALRRLRQEYCEFKVNMG